MWATDNKLSGEFADFRQVCSALGITCHKTQSGKVALTQAIVAARKKAPANSVAVSEAVENVSPSHTHMSNTHVAATAQGAVPATESAVTAATLMQQAITLLGVAGQPSNTLSPEQMMQVRELIAEYAPSRKLVVENVEQNTTKVVDAHHWKLPLLIRFVSMKRRKHLYLHGPAGTGKSHIAWQIADALQLPFACMSFCAQSGKSDLLGYMDAHGNYVSTPFYDIYKNGGVFCLDEMDAANPNLINLLNGGLAGKMMSFPCGMVQRHPDFVVVASANTFGTGSTEMFIGRNPLDAASQDRFQKVYIDYDRDLERAIYSQQACEMVWAERDRLAGRTGYVLSMRAIERVDDYLSSGFTPSEAYEYAIADSLQPNLRK
jgi:hypothetical protein